MKNIYNRFCNFIDSSSNSDLLFLFYVIPCFSLCFIFIIILFIWVLFQS